MQGSAEAALTEDWKATPTVATTFSTLATPVHAEVQPAPHPEPLDPLAAFEEELRRFDAIRMAEQHPSQELRAEYQGSESPATAGAGYARQGEYPAEPYQQPQYAEPQAAPDHTWYADSDPARASETRAESSLNAAEDRLAAEAAAAAAASGASPGSSRSRGVFLALGGIAVAGLAIIGGSFVFGSGNKSGSAGTVPVIAAKTEPTKEKPSDPGGIEIPNQNKQVLAARNSPETRPSQVVNTTEQPLDLNQVTKRDSVRIITPSPFQASPGGGTTTADPAAAPGVGPLVEPRRVTSVRIPIGGGDSAPAPNTTTSTAGAASVAAIAAGATARPSTPAPAPSAPSISAPSISAPQPPSSPPASAPVRQDSGAPALPTKVESRPVTAQARPETPKAAPPPRVAATAPRAPNAPLSLDPPKAAAPTAASGGGSGYAIQLASRPNEADARTASTQLRTRFASAIGSRATQVVSGEANGQTVYRVRVGGFSQADAVAACTKVKAAGGGCFVTKQ